MAANRENPLRRKDSRAVRGKYEQPNRDTLQLRPKSTYHPAWRAWTATNVIQYSTCIILKCSHLKTAECILMRICHSQCANAGVYIYMCEHEQARTTRGVHSDEEFRGLTLFFRFL